MKRGWLATALVAGAGSPWLLVTLEASTAMSASIVAVPVSAPSLDAPVVTPFERAPYWLVVDTQSGAVELVDNPDADDPSVLGLRAALALLERGVGMVAASGIGQEVHNLLRARGVSLVAAEQMPARDVVDALVRGALPPLPAPDTAGGADQQDPAPELATTPAEAEPLPRAVAPLAAPQAIAAPRTFAPPPPPPPSRPAVASQVLPELGLRVATVLGTGALVTAVQIGSRADMAGLAAGDLVVTLGGQAVRSVEELRQLAARVDPESALVLGVLHKNGASERLVLMSRARAALMLR